MKFYDIREGQFIFVFLEKPLYEVCFIWIKEQVGEKMGTVCTHRCADWLLKNTSTKHNKYVVKKFHYIDDVLSLNNSRIGDFVHRVYPIELEMQDTTDTDRSASYLDLQLAIDDEGRLGRKHYDKREQNHQA
jgi:hypothetical protein